jgi:O-antigen/teichoic acid export membrane protein
MNMLRSFLKNSLIYAIQPVISKLLLFALVPLYTRYLSAAEYGNIEYVLTICAFYAAVVDMGLSSAFWNFRSSSMGIGEGRVLFNTLLSITAIGALLLMLYVLVWQLFSLQEPLAFWLSLLMIAEIIKKFYDMSLVLFTAQAKPYKFLWGGLLYAILLSLFNFLFLDRLQLSSIGVIYAYALSAIISGVVFLPFLYRNSEIKLDKNLIKRMLGFGLPIMSGNLVLVLMLLSSRFFLKWFTTDELLGQFAFVNKWGTLAQVLLLNAFYTAWNPLRWEIVELPNAKEIFARFYDLFLFLMPSLGFGLMTAVFLLVPGITFDKNYLEAMYVLPFIVQSFVLFAFYHFDAMAFLFVQKTRFILYIMLVTAVANVVLNVTLIQWIGVEGAAWAMFGSYAIMMLITRLLAQRMFRLERNTWVDVLLLTSIFAITILLLYVVKSEDSIGMAKYSAMALGFWVLLNVVLGKVRINDFMVLLNRTKQKEAI